MGNLEEIKPNDIDSEIEQKSPLIRVISYDQDYFKEKIITDISNLGESIQPDKVNWIDVNGTQDLDLIKKLGEIFSIHPLIIEDIHSTNQRLKIDSFQEYLFIVLKAITHNKDEVLELKQVSFILGRNYIITFQEINSNLFEPIFDRIKSKKGRIRKFSTDHLLYTLLDIIVDNYFSIIEDLGEEINSTQELLEHNLTNEILHEIYDYRKKILDVRKAIWPLREVINQLYKTDTNLVSDSTGIYFRDVYDHVFHIIETIESYREMVSGMIELFMTSVSNKMNEVMKILTIISTIFIPLTFIAGIYGMNFQYMPELAWKYGYLIIICVMIVITMGMILFFRRKKWI